MPEIIPIGDRKYVPLALGMRKRKYCILLFLTSLFSFCSELRAQLDSTNLPLVVIDTENVQIQDEPKIDASLKIIYQPGGYVDQDDEPNIYDGKIGIEVRGRYSATLPQQPFGFETRDAQGNNLNVPLFHMPAENDWILLANFNDKVFMRNSLSFELFRKMGHYAPRTQFVEVILNKDYEGIYLLTEKIKRDKGRVTIAKLDTDDLSGDELTGGYIFKVDYFSSGDSWESAYAPVGHPDKTVRFVYEYPKPEDITGAQIQYLQDFVDRLEQTIYSPNTPDRQRRLFEMLDETSFMDYFFIGELSRNVDAYKKSAYFFKDRDSNGGKLHAGPVWDFDWSYKNINECYFGAQDGSGWAYKVHDCDPWPVPPSWMERLLQDPSFANNLADRYFQLRETILSEAQIFNYVDSVATLLEDAQKRHYQRWRILGINVGTPETDQQPITFEGEIAKFKNWIATRLSWLDRNMPQFVVTSSEEALMNKKLKIYPIPASKSLTIEANSVIQSVVVNSLDGRSLKSLFPTTHSTNLNVRNLNAGIYVARIALEDGSTLIRKISVTH